MKELDTWLQKKMEKSQHTTKAEICNHETISLYYRIQIYSGLPVRFPEVQY